MEHARNVCGLAGADHAEYRPDAGVPLIVPVACPLPDSGGAALGGVMTIALEPGSLAARLYRLAEVEEGFNCSYELNQRFEAALVARGLRVAGRGDRGEPRIVELPDRRFFVATLFQPQLNSAPGAPHPLVLAFVGAALGFARGRGRPG